MSHYLIAATGLRLHGKDSTFERAEVIAHEVYDRAAPVPDVTPSPDRNEFLHEVVQAVETAAKEHDIALRPRRSTLSRWIEFLAFSE